jgi:hypothetical protein
VQVDPPQSGDGPNGNILDAVSCPSRSFCAAVDGSGYVTMWNGRAWSQPVQVDHSGDSLNAISCPSRRFCAAVDGGGYATTFNGDRWSRPKDIDGQLYFWSVSCASSSFCVAVGNFDPGANQVVVFNGRSWSKPAQIDDAGGNQVDAVSCPSITFCVAVDDAGNVLTFQKETWSAPVRIDEQHALEDVSCSSRAFCAAVGSPIPGAGSGSEDALTFDGTRWSAPTRIDDGRARNQICEESMVSPCEGISCPTRSFCMVEDDLDHVIKWDGHSWSRPTTLDLPSRLILAVACVSGSFCVATDTGGYEIKYGLR